MGKPLLLNHIHICLLLSNSICFLSMVVNIYFWKYELETNSNAMNMTAQTGYPELIVHKIQWWILMKRMHFMMARSRFLSIAVICASCILICSITYMEEVGWKINNERMTVVKDNHTIIKRKDTDIARNCAV